MTTEQSAFASFHPSGEPATRLKILLIQPALSVSPFVPSLSQFGSDEPSTRSGATGSAFILCRIDKMIRLTALFSVLLCLAWSCPAWASAVQGEKVMTGVKILSQADFILADSVAPPTDAAPWRRQILPDAWPVNHSEAVANNRHNGWYRLRFLMPAGFDSLQSVYLPKLGLNAAVFLNGQFLGDGGRFTEPFGRNWNRPLLFLVPPGTLRSGENTLHVRLLSHAYTQASLSPIEVGPDRTLRPRYERVLFFRVSLNQAASLLIAGMGVLMLSLWWRRRQDTAYGYFALSALLWAAQSSNLYLQEISIRTEYWEMAINSSFQVFWHFC